MPCPGTRYVLQPRQKAHYAATCRKRIVLHYGGELCGSGRTMHILALDASCTIYGQRSSGA